MYKFIYHRYYIAIEQLVSLSVLQEYVDDCEILFFVIVKNEIYPGASVGEAYLLLSVRTFL